MSYILDALKESQSNRDEQQVPDIRTIHAAPEQDYEQELPRRNYALIIGLLLLIALGAAGGWWWAGLPAEVAVNTEPTAALPAIPVEIEPLVNEPAEAEQIAIVESVDQAELITVIPDQPTKPGRPAKIIPSKTSTSEQVVEPGIVDVIEQPIKTAKIDEPDEASKASTAEVIIKPTQNSELQNPLASTTEEPAKFDSVATEVAERNEPSADDKPAQRVPHYRELPFEVQQEIKEISFSVHLFSPRPATRMVKIDGIVRREGSEVSKGLVLDEITARGAIFTYRDYRFQIPVR